MKKRQIRSCLPALTLLLWWSVRSAGSQAGKPRSPAVCSAASGACEPDRAEELPFTTKTIEDLFSPKQEPKLWAC